jgi:IclR family transcriptional regulator, acetate operon repressor
LSVPRSATHRVLTSLVEHGYVRQERYQGAYVLTAKIASLAFTFLTRSGITDLAQPILDRLARETGELVRLAIVDGRQLTWVAKAQGSQFGLRYAPQTPQALLKYLRLARKRGYSIAVQTFTPWMSAMAAPIHHPVTGEVTGTVSIAGPHVRLTEIRLHEMAPLLLDAAKELSLASTASPALVGGPNRGRPNIFAQSSLHRREN